MEAIAGEEILIPGRARPPSLVWSPHPILAAAGRRLEYAEFQPCESIAQYLARVGVKLGSQPAALYLDGEYIPRGEWPLTFPASGQLITLRALVQDGEGGSNPLQIVLTIVVLVASYYTAGAVGAAYGSAYGAVAGAAVTIAGNLLISALLPPPSANLGRQLGENISPTYSLAGGSNRARPYEPLPVIFGVHRVFPDYGAKYYTEFQGDDQYLFQVFNFGLSDIRLSQFKIGSTPIENFQGVDLQISGLDGRLTLFPGNVDAIGGGELRAALGPVVRSSSTDAIALAVEISGNLFYTGNTGLQAQSVTLQIEFRLVGALTWLPMAYGQAVAARANYWSAGHYDGGFWVQVAYGGTDSSEHTGGDFFNAARVITAFNSPIGPLITNTWRYRPYSEIDNYAVYHLNVRDPSPPRDYYVSVPQVTITSDSRKPIRRTYRVDVPRGQYDVRVTRITPDETDARATSEMVWTQLRTYQPDPADYTGQTRAALKIKASGQLQGQVQQLSAIAAARVAIWNGSAYNWGETRNPAWAYLRYAAGQFIGGSRMFGAGLDDSRIDFEAIKLWAVFCAQKNLTFDAVFDSPISCAEALIAIARCGRAAPSWGSGKLGVVWDAPDQPAVAVFGMSNIKAGSFRVEYLTEKLADEIVLSFVNPDLDWQQDTVRAVVPGVSQPSSPAAIDFFGCANKSMAGREANLLAGAQKYRRRRVTWESDWEGLVVNRGDVAIVSHDLTQWGYSGRLVAGTTMQLTLDRKVPFSAGQQHYIGVRFPDGSYNIYNVVGQSLDADVIDLVTPLPSAPDADPAHPPLDYIWCFEPKPTPGKKVKIVDVQPLSEQYVKLVAVDETPEYYAAENGHYVYAPPAKFGAIPPVLTNLQIVETLLRAGAGFAVQLSLSWDASGSYYQGIVRGGINGKPLEDLGVTNTRRFDFSVPDNGSTIALEVTGIHPLGYSGPDSKLSATYSILGKAAPPPDVPWFAIDADKLSWGQVQAADLAGYVIRFHPGSKRSFGDAVALHDGVLTDSPYQLTRPPSDLVTLMICAIDTSKNFSVNPAVIITNLGDAIVANLIESFDVKAAGWPGTIVNATVDGAANLVADDATGLMWKPTPASSMWGLASASMYLSAIWKEMSYEFQIAPHLAQAGSAMTLDYTIQGETWNVQYRRNGLNPMWIADAELMWRDDAAALWNIPDYQPWPGTVIALSEPFDFLVTVGGGGIQGKLSQFAVNIDVPDIVERLNDIVLSPGGTRLPIANIYNIIKNVSLTVQDDGGSAVSAKVLDKNALLGPLSQAVNSSNIGVTGKVDAVIQGY